MSEAEKSYKVKNGFCFWCFRSPLAEKRPKQKQNAIKQIEKKIGFGFFCRLFSFALLTSIFIFLRPDLRPFFVILYILPGQTLKIEIIDSHPKKNARSPSKTAARRAAMSLLQAGGGFALGRQPAARPAARLARAATSAIPTGLAAGALAAATSYRGAGSKRRGASHSAFSGRAVEMLLGARIASQSDFEKLLRSNRFVLTASFLRSRIRRGEIF
jgi:hypothetical protein